MNWPKFLENGLHVLKQTDNDLIHFKSLHTSQSRVAFLLERKSIYLSELKSFYSKYCSPVAEKNSQLSEECRKKGNTYYAQKLNKKAFFSFSHALMYSADLKSTLLAYSNRSAVFYDEKLYEKCLIDIDQAFKVFSSLDDKENLLELVFKLLNRKKTCHFYLNQRKHLQQMKTESISLLSFAQSKIESLNHEIDELIQKLSNNMPLDETSTASNSNTTTKGSIMDCVDIKYEQSKGRYCVANRTISAGECLFVEKAYCAILIPEFASSYCQNCFKAVYEPNSTENELVFNFLNIEFCSKCNTVVYCSEECKQKSAFHHSFECEILANLLHNLGIAHLAYRVVATTSRVLFTSVSQTADAKDIMKDIDYSNERNSRDIDYEQVFHLVTHEKETHVYDLFKYTMTSILLGSFYVNKLNSPSNNEQNDSDLIQISSLILRHLLQAVCNAHAITQMRDDSQLAPTYSREQIRYATAFYPKVSLMNHSCDSNVISSFKENSDVIVVKASRNIPKGAQIFNCYGPHYLKMNLSERKQSLLEQYRFDCQCEPCSLSSKSTVSNLKCFKCKSNSTQASNHCTEIKCLKCLNVTSINKYADLYEMIVFNLNQLNLDEYGKCVQLVNSYRSMLFLNETNQIELKNLEDNFKMFYLDYARMLDVLARLSCDMNMFEQATDLTEKSIQILKHCYGAESIELLHEILKLAEIQCNCRKFTEANENAEKGIAIARKLCSDESKLLKEFLLLKDNILDIQTA